MYSRITWSLLCGRTWAVVGVLLSLALPVHPTCPQNVELRARSCFDMYSRDKDSLERQKQKLCCGLDVEQLRRFCQSYSNAIRCISGLQESCPKHFHHTIRQELRILDDSAAVLDELCVDDSIIEIYAMHQHCFRNKGDQTQQCFRQLTNHSAPVPQGAIRFLTQVNIVNKNDFCRDMNKVVSCVGDIYRVCGDRAVELAGVLVKPMVRQSGMCEYTQHGHQQTTLSSHHNNPAYISDGDRQTDAHTHNRGRGLAADVISALSLALSLLWIRLLRGS